MAVINETLKLTDQFSASFRTFIDLGNRAVQSTVLLDRNLTRAMGKSAGATMGAIRQLGDQSMQTNRLLEQIAANQTRHTEETKRTNTAAGGLLRTLKNVAAVTGATLFTKAFASMADEYANTNARLNLMTGSLEETAALQEQLYASAQRTRSSYSETASMVASLGQRAGAAFDSSAEILQFAENINKQFKIAGAGQQEISSATLQLTQALGAGVLRGEELNAVFDAAPNIIQTIADYMGEPIENIRQLASEGKITASVVKNALLSATEEIDDQFKELPMTLAQAFTMGRNAIQKSLQGSFEGWSDFLNSDEGQKTMNQMISLFSTMAQVGVDALAVLGQGALWTANHLNFILPILAAIALGYAFVKSAAIAEAAASVAGAVAKAAAWALSNWYIILGIALIAAALIAAQQFGIGMTEVCGWVGQVLGMLYAIGYNVFASLWNVIASFAEAFANVWNDPLGATARLFFDVFDTILGIVETVAGAIDALLGTSLSGAVAGFREKMSGWVSDTFGENDIQIERMANLDVGATSRQFGDYGANLGSKLDNMNLSLDSLVGNLSGFDASAIPKAFGGSGGGTGGLGDVGKVGSVGNVKNIEGDVSLSDEDLKLYRDLAERRYMNKVELKTLAPNISVTLPAGASGKLDPKEVADYIKKMLIEQMGANTEVVHG